MTTKLFHQSEVFPIWSKEGIADISYGAATSFPSLSAIVFKLRGYHCYLVNIEPVLMLMS